MTVPGSATPRRADGRLDWEPVAGDLVRLRAAHVCGDDRMAVTLAGLDVRLACAGCGARVVLARPRLRSRVAEVLGTVADLPAMPTPAGH